MCLSIRLRRRRERDRAIRRTQSVEHREPRLQYDRERHREARFDERLEHREARLQCDRESHREARSLLLSAAIYYVICPSTFISALLLSVHTHYFLLSYNAVFLDVETLHDIANLVNTIRRYLILIALFLAHARLHNALHSPSILYRG